tara:strand:- start:2502 stop:3158 length:657 start_codon:yes stop_codon:yes gene_type:complete
MWDDFLNRIETEFNSDKKTFLQRPLIKKTIACIANELCDSISSQIGTEHFIQESNIGAPSLYKGYTLASYQHYWYIHLVEKHIKPIGDFNSIVDIGAGYGNLRRLIGNRCENYSIVDFPIMHEIQKYFLENNNIDNTNFISQNEIKEADLLFASHSICEIPIEERDFIPWGKFKNAFVYFNPTAFGLDNDKYFNEIAEEHNGKIFIDEIRPRKKYLII